MQRGTRERRRLAVIRILVVLTTVTAVDYIVWRWFESVNWAAWWIAVPLVAVETYSVVDCLLFGITVWRLRERPAPPPPPADATVDVFITTYNEPVDLVMTTATAAVAITHPHRTWILDDGARDEMRAAAEAAGVGYVTRSGDWAGHSRHAKAGNLNNALAATDGEFILILDADQVPEPEILDRTLGYFADPEVALVQTPQFFVNVPDEDPLGSQAPLFYGPIQQGKDGWNAAFFCGSNAVLRREAMMLIGVRGYVDQVERSVAAALRTADKVLARARRSARADLRAVAALNRVAAAVTVARGRLAQGEPLGEVTYAFQRRVEEAAAGLVADDLATLQADLAEIERLGLAAGPHAGPDATAGGPAEPAEAGEAAVTALTRRDWSPLGALESVRALVAAVDVDRSGEAQAVMPMATISVTEDMATSMRLHAHGWRTVYHHEPLAFGLAPEDLGTMLTQRLRWAQGTIQVMLRENPLLQRGLSGTQRLMYFATMWSYLSGFAALVYLAAPVIYLCFGVLPVTAFSVDFFARLLPFLLVNQLLFLVISRGHRTWRGQQYSLALFPVWIRACTTAVRNVVFGRPLGFAVTPKVRQEWRPQWRLVRVQLVTMAVLVVAAVVGTARMAAGVATVSGTLVNLLWVAYDVVLLSAVVKAARYRGHDAPVPAGSVPAVPTVSEKEAQLS
ncbi:glycosyltransferase family 2 protein [Nakamurella endophytica]|uniref:Cellulose synthase n=1 Tax=Nakamurella endophytica TaxID=1748367 RepID=A0A917WGK5_9ACTN|nr:glycosyltransferase family 2 protein [Nakamurella endophytica]GGM03438.1 cellulose synthase [Nakamurella endophytica]